MTPLHRVRSRAAVLCVVAAALLLATARPASATTFSRLPGADRYETAVEISRARWSADDIHTVFVASGENFPDALAGGPAAAAYEGPILLTQKDRLPSSTASELRRLKPSIVYVLGGPAAVSDAVLSELEPLAHRFVARIAGDDRYATAAETSRYTFDPDVSVAYVASGLTFADALSGGAAGGPQQGPVLLVEPGTLPLATEVELTRLQPRSIVILGGSEAVSHEVEEQLDAHTTGAVARAAGTDRYSTSVKVSERTYPGPVQHVFLASGVSFADALVGGVEAAMAGGPVLLTGRDCIPAAVNAEIDRLGAQELVLFGGTRALSPEVAARKPCA